MVALCRTSYASQSCSFVQFALYRLHVIRYFFFFLNSKCFYKSILQILSANMGPAVQVKPTTQTTETVLITPQLQHDSVLWHLKTFF